MADSASGWRGYRNAVITGQRVVLDGCKFTDCELHNCILVYKGGRLPVFSQSSLFNCSLLLEKSAARTLTLLSMVYPGLDDPTQSQLRTALKTITSKK
jgi:hypothetical protein